jgi:hypothetical protein
VVSVEPNPPAAVSRSIWSWLLVTSMAKLPVGPKAVPSLAWPTMV